MEIKFVHSTMAIYTWLIQCKIRALNCLVHEFEWLTYSMRFCVDEVHVYMYELRFQCIYLNNKMRSLVM